MAIPYVSKTCFIPLVNFVDTLLLLCINEILFDCEFKANKASNRLKFQPCFCKFQQPCFTTMVTKNWVSHRFLPASLFFMFDYILLSRFLDCRSSHNESVGGQQMMVWQIWGTLATLTFQLAYLKITLIFRLASPLIKVFKNWITP